MSPRPAARPASRRPTRPASGRLAAVTAVLVLAVAACAPSDAPSDAPTDAAVSVPVLGTAADGLPAARVLLVGPDGGEAEVRVRVAATPEARSRGLMGVAALPDGAGMLFRFPDLGAHGGFWMRGTLVPLDIAFLAEGVVVAVATMTPCADDPCPITRPGRPYDGALEVPAGWLGRAGVVVGTEVRVVAQ